MNDKHTPTPGPWQQRVIEFGSRRYLQAVIEVAETGISVAEVRWTTDDAWNANARLIAAAPDLLRVAELVVSWLDEEPGAHKLCDAARAAISRATSGEQT